MTNKNSTIIFSLLMFSAILLVSCSDDSTTGPLNITGLWNSGEYMYYSNCEGDGVVFDDYISYLILVTQEDDAQTQVDIACAFYGENWCNTTPVDTTYQTRADSIFAAQMEYIIFQWDADSTYVNELIAENTYVQEVMDIQLNINLDNTYTISYEGTCVDYNTMDDQTFCENSGSGTLWDGVECIFTTEYTCEHSSYGNGDWDDGSSGLLDESGDEYVMDDVNDNSIFEGKELIFDGNSISITIITEENLCIGLSFSK